MNFKIDTKEKFKEITILESHLTANMTDDLELLFKDVLEKPGNNIVLSLKPVIEIDTLIANKIASIQQLFYDSGSSFVICEVQQAVEMMLDGAGAILGSCAGRNLLG